MTTHTLAQGTRSSSVLDLGTLASATYVMSSAIDLGAAIPIDVTFEVEATPSSAPLSNKQLILFCKFSLDGTNYGSGPESLAVATEEADLHFIGVLPMNANALHRKFFNISGLPTARYMKLIVKNDIGVALTSGNVYQANISANSA